MNSWTPLGPEGGFVCGLAAAPADPSQVYAAGYDVFQSSDSGVNWEPAGERAGASHCNFSVDAVDARRLYSIQATGLGGSRVARSVDGGSTWEFVLEDLPDYPSSSVAVTRQDPNLLFFSTETQVYRSQDRGDAWQAVWYQPGVRVQFVAIDPSSAERILLVTAAQGLRLSEDGGDHWAPFGLGLPAGLRLGMVAFDPRDSTVLYLSTTGGVYRSRDGGASWVSSLVAEADGVAGQLVVREDSTVLVVQRGGDRSSVWRSSDGGESWQDLGNPYPWLPQATFASFVVTPTALLGTNSSGVARSTDGGESWQESNTGLVASSLLGLRLDRQNPERLFGLDQLDGFHSAGILRSHDRGATWQLLALPPPGEEARLVDFAIDPSNSLRYYAATDFQYANPNGFRGVFSSQDAGETWTAHGGPFLRSALTELEVDPLDGERIYLSSRFILDELPADCYNWRSEDSGATWECIGIDGNEDILRRIAPSSFEAGTVLALGGSGIYRSVNAGQDWTLVAGPPVFSSASFSDLLWANASTAYATSAGPWLYRSEDGGLTWQARVPSPDEVPDRPWLTNLASDPFRADSLYALAKPDFDSDPREVVRTQDGGLTWFALEEVPNGGLETLIIDPVTPNRLYVSTFDSGVLAYDLQQPEPCVPSATALCIMDGRFRIESLWRDFAGNSGVGRAVPLAADTGAFWFFSPDNLELFVKEVDGVDFNNAFWTFYGALSNVEFTLLATDTVTGAQHGYFNPSRRFASLGDIESFPQGEGFAPPTSTGATAVPLLRPQVAPRRSTNSCVPNATTLCLSANRFAASVTWRDFAGRTGVGTPLVLTPDTGSFWFFDAGIHELAVKVIDGRGTNDAFWVFYGSLSNVEFELTVVDTETGDSWTRENPLGTFASNGDIEAFPQLP